MLGARANISTSQYERHTSLARPLRSTIRMRDPHGGRALKGSRSNAQNLAAALNHSAFNPANALGPGLGGLALAGFAIWVVALPADGSRAAVATRPRFQLKHKLGAVKSPRNPAV